VQPLRALIALFLILEPDLDSDPTGPLRNNQLSENESALSEPAESCVPVAIES
jgi:hypothetical protein